MEMKMDAQWTMDAHKMLGVIWVQWVHCWCCACPHLLGAMPVQIFPSTFAPSTSSHHLPTGANDAGGCLRTGNQILDRWGFGDWPLWASYVGLVGTWGVLTHVRAVMRADVHTYGVQKDRKTTVQKENA